MAPEKYVPSEEEMKEAEEQMSSGQAGESKARERNLTSNKKAIKLSTFERTTVLGDFPRASVISNHGTIDRVLYFDPGRKVLGVRHPDSLNEYGKVYEDKADAIQILNEEIKKAKELDQNAAVRRSIDALEELKHRIESEEGYDTGQASEEDFTKFNRP